MRILLRLGLVAMIASNVAVLVYVGQAFASKHINTYFGVYACLILALSILMAMTGLYPKPVIVILNGYMETFLLTFLTLSAMILAVASLPIYYGMAVWR